MLLKRIFSIYVFITFSIFLNGTFLFDECIKGYNSWKFKAFISHSEKDLFSSTFKENSYTKIINFFSIQAFSCKVLIEALNKFKNGELHLFDPVVGDSQCQTRAMRIAQFFNLLKDRDSRFFDVCEVMQLHCSEILKNIDSIASGSKDEFMELLLNSKGFKLNKLFTLNELFKAFKLEIDKGQTEIYTDHIKFIALCYFNCSYQTEESSLEKYVLDVGRIASETALMENEDYIIKIFKVGVQRTIAQLSQNFLLQDKEVLDRIALNNNIELWSEITQAVKILCEGQYKISPAYFGLQTLFLRAFVDKIPIVVRVHSYNYDGKADPYLRYYFYKVNNDSQLELCERSEIAGKGAIFIYGISYPGCFHDWQKSFKFEFENFAKELKTLPEEANLSADSDLFSKFRTIGICKLIEIYYATRKDYYSSCKSNLDWSLYPKSYENKEIQRMQAHKIGCCQENMSLFIPDHMYSIFVTD